MNHPNTSNTNTTNLTGSAPIQPPDISVLFSMYDKVPAHQCITYRNPLSNQLENTQLSATYFSTENMRILQNGIRAGVYHASNGQYLVGEQECASLKIIMRSIFLQHSKNLPNHIPEQIAALNKLVLNQCVPSVLSEAGGYLNYLRDASTLAVPMALPTMTSNYGNKMGEMKSWMGSNSDNR
jgi:hypothetical protein